MRIAWITAGAGHLYCGACARDLALVRGLLARGHDVQVIPLYTPLRSDADDPVPTAPIFYSGINVFLQQWSGIFRRAPVALHRALASPRLLSRVSRLAVNTEARKLGALTVSVLAGQDGRQRRELEHLLEYLEQPWRAEGIHLSNSLLSGLAPTLKSRLKVPVVGSLQGEDTFVDRMPEPHRSEARRLMQANCHHLDRLIAPCAAHAAEMAGFLHVARERISIIRPALDWKPYPVLERRPRDPFVIGWLAAIRPGKGLEVLIEAARRLIVDPKRKAVVRMAGQVLDRSYWRSVQRQIRKAGLTADVELQQEPDFQQKIEFLRGCSVLAVTSQFAESRGIAALEAQAVGIPVAAPDTGVFPEMFALTGGGVTYPSGEAAVLAQQIGRFMDDSGRADRMGQHGAEMVRRTHSVEQASAEMEAEFSRLV